jgi:hypothetical protein
MCGNRVLQYPIWGIFVLKNPNKKPCFISSAGFQLSTIVDGLLCFRFQRIISYFFKFDMGQLVL